LNIYIAPLQENYSEELPTPARLNKAVLRWEKNAGGTCFPLAFHQCLTGHSAWAFSHITCGTCFPL